MKKTQSSFFIYRELQSRDVAQHRLPPAIGFYHELATCCTCEGYSHTDAAASIAIGVAHLLHELQINIVVQCISFLNNCTIFIPEINYKNLNELSRLK